MRDYMYRYFRAMMNSRKRELRRWMLYCGKPENHARRAMLYTQACDLTTKLFRNMLDANS